MNQIFKLLILPLMLLGLPTVTRGQGFDQLIGEMVSLNPELKSLEKEYLAALEKAPQVSQMPDPEVGIGGFPLPVETRLGAQHLRLSAGQMMPWPGTLDSKKELELAKARPLLERMKVRQLEIEYDLKQAYFRLYEIGESQAIVQRNLAILESLERLALSRVESGKTTIADVLTVQLKIEEMEQELAILEVGKTAPTTVINQLLYRDPATPVAIMDTFSMAVLPFDKNELIASIKENHPMLRMYEWQQEASKQAIVLNGLNSKPSFGLGVDYIMVSQRDDAFPSGNGRDILQLRATMKIPFYKEQYAAKDREEQLKVDALEYKKEDTQSRFAAAVERAFAEYEMAVLKVELYEKQRAITRSAIRVLEADYSTQGANFAELLRLEKELVEYDLKMLKAVVQSHLAKAAIERFYTNQ